MVKKASAKTRLDRVRERLAKEKLGGKGNYWKPKQGRNVIRVLPGVGDMEDFFWQDVGRHYPPDTQFSFVCPEFTLGEDDAACPICEFVNELYRAGDDDSKELAKKLRVRRQFWMNIIDRNDEDRGPQIFTPGVTVFGSIASMVNDPDYGEVYDVDDGLDIIIKRDGTGLATEYHVQSRRKSTPLSKTDSQIDDWLEAAIDLSVVELTDDPSEDKDLLVDGVVVSVMPYDRIKADFERLDVASDIEEEDNPPFSGDEDDEDEVRKTISKRRSTRRRRR